jgi:hypothetical protein
MKLLDFLVYVISLEVTLLVEELVKVATESDFRYEFEELFEDPVAGI